MSSRTVQHPSSGPALGGKEPDARPDTLSLPPPQALRHLHPREPLFSILFRLHILRFALHSCTAPARALTSSKYIRPPHHLRLSPCCVTPLFPHKNLCFCFCFLPLPFAFPVSGASQNDRNSPSSNSTFQDLHLPFLISVLVTPTPDKSALLPPPGSPTSALRVVITYPLAPSQPPNFGTCRRNQVNSASWIQSVTFFQYLASSNITITITIFVRRHLSSPQLLSASSVCSTRTRRRPRLCVRNKAGKTRQVATKGSVHWTRITTQRPVIALLSLIYDSDKPRDPTPREAPPHNLLATLRPRSETTTQEPSRRRLT